MTPSKIALLLLLALLPLPTLAQQDNSNKSYLTFNVNQPGTLQITDRTGNLVTITVVPDTQGPIKIDAMKACSAAIAAAQPGLVALMAIPVAPVLVPPSPTNIWQTSIRNANPLLQTAKIKIDAALAALP
jgi:hypothetical protein